jgi:hypothetical protein
MITFTTQILKFEKMGEKTGWTYIDVGIDLAHQLKPDFKKAFRVKGKLDAHEFSGIALVPMGDGNYILALKADLRRKIGKNAGAMVRVELEEDTSEFIMDSDFMECLAMEERGLAFFKSLAPSHQRYFCNWITSAKTQETKVKRIAKTVNALVRRMDYGSMIREK